MFLAAVARPRFDANGTVIFDGKLGIWPFTYMHGSFIGTSSSRTSLIDQKEYSYMLKMI